LVIAHQENSNFTGQSFWVDRDVTICAECNRIVPSDAQGCPNCGMVVALNWLRNPLTWLAIGISSISVYGGLAYALIHLWRS
jgi:hypothetical protein